MAGSKVTRAPRAGSMLSTGPGRRVTRIPVAIRLDGSMLEIPVHVAEGTSSGPTLTLVATQHGHEWFPIGVIRRVIEGLDLSVLRGRVIAIPVANPMALERQTRMTPDDSDEPDLNRTWPGSQVGVAEQIAAALTDAVIAHSDVVVDFHSPPWGAAAGSIGYGRDFEDQQIVLRSLELAVAFGYPSIRGLNVMTRFPGPRSLQGFAGSTLRIPSISPDLGGSGFSAEIEEEWLSANVEGVRNLMRQLQMLPGEPVLPPRYFHSISRGHRVVPRSGGLLEPIFGPESLLTEVRAGTLLGRLISPYTFETLEELKAPVDGVLIAVCREHPTNARGLGAYIVAPTGEPGSGWVDAGASVAATAAAMLKS